jgi:hypothetical protein
MEEIAYFIGASLPMAVFIFIGSYFGLWKRRKSKLSFKETVILFLSFWVLSAILTIIFKLLLSGQEELIQSTIGNLWGPLIVGVIIGRKIIEWRHKIISDNDVRKSYEPSE